MEFLAVALLFGGLLGGVGYWLDTKCGAALDRLASWMER